LLDAPHAQPLPAVTLIVRVPPEGSTLKLRGDTSKVQPGDCVIVRTCPAIVAVPVRDGPLVAAAVTVTEAGPDPDAGPTEIQSALLEAVHGHPAPEVMATARVPPAASSEYVAGVMVYVHPSDCVTLKCSPAIVIVPARGGPVVGATVKVTVADPFPLAFELTVIQSTSDTAVQVQSALEARTSTVPVPPV